MIIGIGNDVSEIQRVKRVYEKHGMRFVKRILAPEEQKVFSVRKQKISYLAKRFAVKEATAKALGTGMRRGVAWRQIVTINLPSGAPTLLLRGGAQRRFKEIGGVHAHVSISDEVKYALAFVIITGK